ncbi:hypothetical protein QFZ37_003199 [Chryseobacterium ginsenosidimutans]|nr:hypothetical protein [Chryseobacterium ginsenosidimutans]
MKVNFYKPKNSSLEKYIEGYYFIAEDIDSKLLRSVSGQDCDYISGVLVISPKGKVISDYLIKRSE